MIAYVRAYQKQHNIKNNKIISGDPDSPVYQCFGMKRNELIYEKEKHIYIMNKFYTTYAGFKFRKKYPQLVPVTIFAYVRTDLFDYNRIIRFSDVVKVIYQLPKSTTPDKCVSLSSGGLAEKLLAEGVIIPNRTVLMNPYANSVKELSLDLFEKIVKELTNWGINVIVSAQKGKRRISNAYHLDFTLDEAIPLCNAVGFVIGARSGFMDLVSFSNAAILSIDSDEYPHSDLFLLEDCWQQNHKIKTIRLCNGNEEELIKKVVDNTLKYFNISK